MLRLLVYGPSWGSPSLDAACTRAYACLLFAGLKEGADFIIEACDNPHRSLGGELPVLEVCSTGQLAEGPHEVCAALKKLGHDADAGLGPSQRAESAAFAALVEERLQVALLYSWWEDEANYNAVVRPALAKALPIPLCYYLPWSMRKRVRSQLARRRCGSADAAYGFGEAALNALSTRLGGSGRLFFHGDAPTSVDASAFAYLSAILRCPLPNSRLRDALKSHATLVSYVERIAERYFGGSAPLLPAVNAPVLGGPSRPLQGMQAFASAAAAAAEQQSNGNGSGADGAATKEKRNPKQAAFKRRSRNALIGAAGVTFLYAIATDQFARGAEEGDSSGAED